jgi:N-acetylneuraminic acid mutarotase
MKNKILFFAIFFTRIAFSQTNATYFTWLKGGDQINQTGFYGMPGNALNTPGSRSGTVEWTLNGKLYLFGGQGNDGSGGQGNLNDLWEYDPATNNWTWLKGSSGSNSFGSFGTIGVASATNVPAAKFTAVGWVANGKLYLYGGTDPNSNYNNDLWEYNPATNNWTWIKGSNTVNQIGVYGSLGLANAANTPGARRAAQTFDYNGNLYLFGGVGYPNSATAGRLSDLWMYSPSTNNWTWIGGEQIVNQLGVYGMKGVGSASNLPGARYGGASTQISNKFYLFGGNGYGEAGSFGLLNDLWEYDVSNGQWKYLNGSKTISVNGVYNTQFQFNNFSKPGSRESAKFLTYNNKLYLFAGRGFDVNDISSAYLSDIFAYDITANQWAWLRGNTDSGHNGVFGMQGVPNANNRPSARYNGAAWYHNHKLYYFGGYGLGSTGITVGFMNDMWTYIPSCTGTTDFYSTKNGNWNDPTVWSCGRVPENTASIGIKGHTITVNGNFGIRGIEFTGGNLVFPNMSTLTYYPIVP